MAISFKRCKTKSTSEVSFLNDQVLVDPDNNCISFDYVENSTNKRFTLNNPIVYSAIEPDTTNLVENKTVWIG